MFQSSRHFCYGTFIVVIWEGTLCRQVWNFDLKDISLYSGYAVRVSDSCGFYLAGGPFALIAVFNKCLISVVLDVWTW